MAMGSSGGRSAGNKTTGERRATQRERALIDPPGHDAWEKVKVEGKPWTLTTRGEKVVAIITLGVWVFMCAFGAILFAAWFNLI